MEAATRWLADQQRWQDAPRILRSSVESLASPLVLDSAQLNALAAQAVDTDSPTRGEKAHQLAALVAQLPEHYCIALAAQWLATDCVYLHLLIPEILRARRSASGAFAQQVLEWGIGYPDPSLNRPFVEAAMERLGRDHVVQALLKQTEGVANAYYWLQGGATLASERLLRRRLAPFAQYLRRWWRLW